MQPVNLGRIPTPAVALYAIARARGSIMVTGSHIPFDRNGYKTYTAQGELLKQHEEPIGQAVSQVRTAIYSRPFDKSPFDELGLFKGGHRALPPESNLATAEYIERYSRFFTGLSLRGQRILVYQHSSVGRDILVEILDGLGAEAIPAGRIDTFVPLDTENVDEAMVAAAQVMVDEAAEKHGPISGVVSLDGDADRPLILGVDSYTGKLKFFGGDLVGMVAAEYLGADAVVVPISCNDAIDRGGLAPLTEPKTRIGSPYVIAGMEKARRAGRRVVCGWEANGGFLTGSDIEKNGNILRTLPTRDAVLPILAVLMAAQEKGLSLAAVFQELPKRFSRAALLKKFPRRVALEIVRRVSPDDSSVHDVAFDAETRAGEMETIRRRLGAFFTPRLGFGSITKLNYTDGVRITFNTGDVAHVRPSGNADEFRIYAVADTQERADFIAQAAVAEPDGILRLMERAFAG
jgi:phosphomannomutase